MAQAGDTPIMPWEDPADPSESRFTSLLAESPELREQFGLPDPEPAEEPEAEEEAPEPDAEVSEEVQEDEPDDETEVEEPEGEDLSDEEVEDDGSTEDDPIFTVTVDGKEIEVPLSELRRGYSGTAATTKRFQEAAEIRKQAEAEAESYRAKRSEVDDRLAQLEQAIEQMAPSDPDWNQLAMEMSSDQLAQTMKNWKDTRDYLANIKAERAKIAEQKAQEQKAFEEKFHQEEQQKLLDAIPAWREDPSLAAKERAEITKYAESRGFAPDEIEKYADHRSWLLLRDAMLYSKGAKEVNAPKASKPKKTLKPGGKKTLDARKPIKTKEIRSAREQLRRSGRADDAEALLRMIAPEDI